MLRFLAPIVLTVAAVGLHPVQIMAQSEADVAEAIEEVRVSDPGLESWFSEAYGYAVFPVVGKIGVGVGGARGRGLVYEQGKLIGRSTLTQLSVGLQLGGQEFIEVIFFEDKASFDDFTNGEFELGAQYSAVALDKGVSGNLTYDGGIAIVTATIGGLMYEATVGGQRFEFERIEG